MSKDIKCKTCFDTKEVPDNFDDCGGVAGACIEIMHMNGELMMPCPDCQQPKCKTCGDSKEIPEKSAGCQCVYCKEGLDDCQIKVPCPDCQRPIAGDLKDIQAEVGSWAEKQFDQSTNSSICEHLRREVKELKSTFKPSEAADCFLILLHFAHKNKFDILSEALKKHTVNKNRNWGEPDEDGVVEHIPNLKQQPPAGEWTKEMRKKWALRPKVISPSIAAKDIFEACDIIDQAEADKADLLTAFIKYGNHRSDCNLLSLIPCTKKNGKEVGCTCGFYKAEAVIAKTKEKI